MRLMFGGWCLFGLVATGLLFAVLINGGLIVVLFLPFFAWGALVAYVIFFRLAVDLQFDGAEVTWRSAFRSGRVPLAQIVAITHRPMGDPLGPLVRLWDVDTVQLDGGGSVEIAGGPGLDQFTAVLAEASPRIEVQLSSRSMQKPLPVIRRSGFSQPDGSTS